MGERSMEYVIGLAVLFLTMLTVLELQCLRREIQHLVRLIEDHKTPPVQSAIVNQPLVAAATTATPWPMRQFGHGPSPLP